MEISVGLAFDSLSDEQKQRYILHYATAFAKPIDCEGCVLRIVKFTADSLWLAPFKEDIQTVLAEDSLNE